MIKELLANHTLICGLCAWAVCQVLKILIMGIKSHQWSIRHLWASGGMPSSHTASVVAVTVGAGLQEGFSSSLFAVCLIFSCVVMRDAAGVRRETGKQGKLINEILRGPDQQNKENVPGELKERVGHSPLEVAAGAVIGIVCAIVICRLL